MNFKIKTKYQLNATGALIFYAYLLVSLAMLITRSHPNLLHAIPVYGSYALYQQASNFVISGMILSGTALFALLNHAKSWSYIFGAAAVIVALNFIMEIFITLGNTKDLKDAIAGLLGVALCLVVFACIDRFGIVRAEKA